MNFMARISFLCFFSLTTVFAEQFSEPDVGTYFYEVSMFNLPIGYGRFQSLGKKECTLDVKKLCFHFSYAINFIKLKGIMGQIAILNTVEMNADFKPEYSSSKYNYQGKRTRYDIIFDYDQNRITFFNPETKESKFKTLPDDGQTMSSAPIYAVFQPNLPAKVPVLINENFKIFSVEWLTNGENMTLFVDKEPYMEYNKKDRNITMIKLMPIRFLGIEFGEISAKLVKKSKK